MAFTRSNVWELGSDWAEPILWYAKGVAAMKQRALGDKASWRFWAAIHGFSQDLWRQVGYLSPSDKMPSSADMARYWKQCQHGSWYFLPWHRGYVLAFEAMVRTEIVNLKGPSDWALPYWNYFKKGQNKLPPAFASAKLPDGKTDNPLHETYRYGPQNDGNIYVVLSDVNLKAMTDDEFIGVGEGDGGSQGFGGPDTGFAHGGAHHGGIESQPHDLVHVLVGGRDPETSMDGLMSNPNIAGLDPIFWLHHANIDRLWEVWRRNPATHQDPTNKNWLNGPAAIGERSFSLPKPDGSAWTYTPKDMEDLATLGYTYDDFAPAITPVKLTNRLARLAGKHA